MKFIDLGWHPFFEAHFQSLNLDDCVAARVCRQDRGLCTLLSPEGTWRGHTPQRHHHHHQLLPVVGDWVAARPLDGEDRAVIEAVLPRRGSFSRTRAGLRSDEQVVAANIDVLLIVQSLEQRPNLRRLERYLTLAWDSGATPIIVLNKADLSSDPEGAHAEAAAACPGVEVLTVSATEEGGVEALTPHLKRGQTLALIGPSGAGKSTLVNALRGSEFVGAPMATGSVRAGDYRGRHTTTHRELMVLPGRGILIDTPGMRELQLSGNAEIGDVFSDIQSLSTRCHFRDCTHHDEPDCGVQAAIAQGGLTPGRLQSFRKLQRELAYITRRSNELSKREALAQHRERMQRHREFAKKKRSHHRGRRY